MSSKLLGALIVVVVGLALLPIVNDFASGLTAQAVITTDTLGSTAIATPAGAFYNTTTGSLIDILPLMFIILLVVGVVGYIKISRN